MLALLLLLLLLLSLLLLSLQPPFFVTVPYSTVTSFPVDLGSVQHCREGLLKGLRFHEEAASTLMVPRCFRLLCDGKQRLHLIEIVCEAIAVHRRCSHVFFETKPSINREGEEKAFLDFFRTRI